MATARFIAVFALGGEDDLVRLLARVKALQGFIATDDGANLLAGYKRAANILTIEEKKDAAAASSAGTPAKAGDHENGGSGYEKADDMDSSLREQFGKATFRERECQYGYNSWE